MGEDINTHKKGNKVIKKKSRIGSFLLFLKRSLHRCPQERLF